MTSSFPQFGVILFIWDLGVVPSGIHNSYIILKNLSSVDAKKILKSSITDLLAFKHDYTIVIFCMYTIRFFVVFVSFYARN